MTKSCSIWSEWTLAALAVSLAIAPTRAAALEWQHDWKSACAKAAADKKPILLVVMNDDEPACQKMLDRIYGDLAVAQKLSGFVLVPCSANTHKLVEIDEGGQKVQSCPKFRGVLCSEHQAMERELRDHFADPASGSIVVPQHVVCDAAGAVLLRHPYAMKRDGFLEFLDNGLALFKDPNAPLKTTRSAAVEKMVDAIVKAKSDDARELAAHLLLAESSPARESALLDAVNRLKTPAEKGVVIRAAGKRECSLWAKTIATLLDEADLFVRDCAIVTLEEEADPAPIADLLELWEKEKDPELHKDLLRAFGPCGGGKPEVKKILLEQLENPKENLRCAAALSLGHFVKGDPEIAAALESRWAKERGGAVPLAIVWGIGHSADPSQAGLIDRLMKNSKDPDLERVAVVAKTWLSSDLGAAIRTLGKGGRPELAHLLAPLFDDDKIERNWVRDLGLRRGKK